MLVPGPPASVPAYGRRRLRLEEALPAAFRRAASRPYLELLRRPGANPGASERVEHLARWQTAGAERVEHRPHRRRETSHLRLSLHDHAIEDYP
jgi:hypothetical protein